MDSDVLAGVLALGDDVRDALASNRPVVALESTIISHGMPWPQNAETALRVEAAVKEKGAVPATIAVLDGRLCAGLNQTQIERIAKAGHKAIKVSRRDFPFLLTDSDAIGATTVAATMIIAEMAGIRVFATGGIGGVHRGASDTFDISADLQELARTSVAVVCAGAKSILDLGLTQEYLETHGVPVIGVGTDKWPAFYTRSSRFDVDYNMSDPSAIAAVLAKKWQVGLNGGALICAPVPERYSMDEAELESLIENAIEGMQRAGVTGKDTTPYLLSEINRVSEGKSLETNIQLVLNNARVASDIAVGLAEH